MIKEKQASETFVERGFELPPKAYEKCDARGPEYGTFYAFVSENGTHITVVKRGGDPEVNPDATPYTMHFDSCTDFALWAQDQT